MNRTSRLVILCAALLLPGMPLMAQASFEPPQLIDRKGYVGTPIWISARAAIDKNTILKRELLGAHTFLDELIEEQRREIEREGRRLKGLEKELKVRVLDQGNCEAKILQSDHLNDQNPAQNFHNLLEYSKNIFEGTVVAVDVGFYSGAPASLLSVQVNDWIRASDEYRAITHLYLYHSAAHFMVGPYEFCGFSPGVEPKRGDKIIVFDFAGLADKERNLLTPGDDKVFAETSSGRLLLPKQLRGDPILSKATSLSEITDLVRRNSKSSHSSGSR